MMQRSLRELCNIVSKTKGSNLDINFAIVVQCNNMQDNCHLECATD